MLLQYVYRICGMHMYMTRSMVAAAWQWAQPRNLIRKNEIHGEEEVRLVLNDSFQLLDETTNEMTMSGQFEVEDCSSLYVELHTYIHIYIYTSVHVYMFACACVCIHNLKLCTYMLVEHMQSKLATGTGT